LLRVLLLRLGALSADAERTLRSAGRCFVPYGISSWAPLRSNPRETGWPAGAAACWRGGSLTPLFSPVCSCRRPFESSSGPSLSSGGRSVRPQCKTMRPHSLPLHGTLLSRDDRAGTRPWLGRGFRRDLWMDCVGRHHCRRQQAHLVGDRAGMGKILVDTVPCSLAKRLLVANSGSGGPFRTFPAPYHCRGPAAGISIYPATA